MSHPANPTPDHVDRIIAQWSTERPDLDATPTGVIGRLHRVAGALRRELVALYAEYGLGEGEFDVLATLRRSGAPYALAPRDLARQTMVTTGAMTKRIDRLEADGLVHRSERPGDGRGRLVGLSERGRTLIDTAFAAHLANEERLLAALSPADRAGLAEVLRRWGAAIGV